MSALWCRWRGHDMRVIYLYDGGIGINVAAWQCRRCKEILGGEVS